MKCNRAMYHINGMSMRNLKHREIAHEIAKHIETVGGGVNFFLRKKVFPKRKRSFEYVWSFPSLFAK